MKRWIVNVVAAAAALTMGVAMAGGAVPPTTISHDSTADLGNGKFLFSGQVTSRRQVCEFLRPVRLKAHYPSGRTQVLDLDTTSVRGAWAMKADITGADRLKVRVSRLYNRSNHLPNNVAVSGRPPGVSHHPPPHHKAHNRRRVICKAASVVWRVA